MCIAGSRATCENMSGRNFVCRCVEPRNVLGVKLHIRPTSRGGSWSPVGGSAVDDNYLFYPTRNSAKHPLDPLNSVQRRDANGRGRNVKGRNVGRKRTATPKKIRARFSIPGNNQSHLRNVSFQLRR